MAMKFSVSSIPSISPTPSILILTGNLGDGHRQAACALAEAFSLLCPEASVQVKDVTEGNHPHVQQIGLRLYLGWITKLPWLYGYLFRRTRGNSFLSRLLKKLPLCSLTHIQALLQEISPTVVISTFPAASAALSRLKAGGRLRIPVVTVITDHTWHSYWLHSGTDRYIVSCWQVRQALLQWPVADSRIAVTGIPVRPAFAEPQNRTAICRKLGLDTQAPVVMIMGGGCGLVGGDWSQLLQHPLLRQGRSRHLSQQIVVVCGHNRQLREQLEHERRGYSCKVMIMGYVQPIHQLMEIADLLITKPGGLTTAEALACNLPMLLYKPLPGQEEDNAAYLVRTGVAIQASNLQQLACCLSDLLEQPRQLAEMRACAAALADGRHSAHRAAADILGEVISYGGSTAIEYLP